MLLEALVPERRLRDGAAEALQTAAISGVPETQLLLSMPPQPCHPGGTARGLEAEYLEARARQEESFIARNILASAAVLEKKRVGDRAPSSFATPPSKHRPPGPEPSRQSHQPQRPNTSAMSLSICFALFVE